MCFPAACRPHYRDKAMTYADQNPSGQAALSTHLIRSVDDADVLMKSVVSSAGRAVDWVMTHDGQPLDLLRRIKFETVGFHPVDGHALNLIEQVNQTWTYVAAIAAVRHLLALHPEAGGFRVAPGAHMSQPLDVMSVAEGLVGAETCAVVHPMNNRKVRKDVTKLASRPELHRYAFFMCPLFPGTLRRPQFESEGVQVWSVDV